jgi:hypothetical protein
MEMETSKREQRYWALAGLIVLGLFIWAADYGLTLNEQRDCERWPTESWCAQLRSTNK